MLFDGVDARPSDGAVARFHGVVDDEKTGRQQVTAQSTPQKSSCRCVLECTTASISDIPDNTVSLVRRY